MTCIEFQQQTRDWILAGRVPEEALAHTGSCPDCAQWLEQERLLSAALADLGRHGRRQQISPNVENVLVGAFRAPNRRGRAGYGWWAAAAAAVVLVAGITVLRYGGKKRDLEPVPVSTATVDVSPFYAIGPGHFVEEDSFAPVVRMRVPRRVLRRIGLTAGGPDPGEGATLEVDVLIGRDGVAKAVRLVRSGESNLQ